MGGFAKCWSTVPQYVAALGSVCIATALRFAVEPYIGSAVPFVTYFLSNTLVIRFTGVGPSLVAIGLSTIAADYLFLPPRYTFSSTPAQFFVDGLFFVANLVVLAAAHDLRRARNRAEASERAARNRAALLDQALTERKRLLDELTEARDCLRVHVHDLEHIVKERTARLEDTVQELEHFSYTITHDLRAPLRAMKGFAQIVEEESCTDCEFKDYLHRMTVGAGRMDTLITDALHYTRSTRGTSDLLPIDIEGLLRGIISSYPNLQPIHADITIEGRLPLVLGNEAALTQCFSNILDNAVKFVRAGTRPRVRIRAEPVPASATGPQPLTRIWFEDNGIGIESEQVPKLFRMFERGSHGYEGTGIGLALVQKNVQRMGGKVGVESKAGQGSRFWIELREVTDTPATFPQ